MRFFKAIGDAVVVFGSDLKGKTKWSAPVVGREAEGNGERSYISACER